jgi:hypothetical protein
VDSAAVAGAFNVLLSEVCGRPLGVYRLGHFLTAITHYHE